MQRGIEEHHNRTKSTSDAVEEEDALHVERARDRPCGQPHIEHKEEHIRSELHDSSEQ